MVGFVGRRLLLTIPTIIGISIIIFLMVRLMPGDIIDVLLGGDASPTEEQKEAAREQLGLSGSYPEQYWNWVARCRPGRLRRLATATPSPSGTSSCGALPITLELMILSLLIATAIGVPLGVISAVRRDSAGDYAVARRRPDRRQHPELLARDAAPALHVAGLRLGAAAHVRVVLRRPADEPQPVHPAGDLDLGLHARDRDADGARDDARGAEPGLRPHGPREGRARAAA